MLTKMYLIKLFFRVALVSSTDESTWFGFSLQ